VTTPRGLMIAALRSGSGKTTITLGLLRALSRLGLKVVGLKSGPDYIDPAYLSAATGRGSVNLDSWAMAPTLLQALAAGAVEGAELAICEASMGLFDGVPAPPGRSGASADVAAALKIPILLVLDVSGQAQSAAAIVKGCMTYDERLRVAAAVLNRVGSPRHRRLAGEAIEALGVPVIGALPRLDALALPERHLGLVQASELPALDKTIEAIANVVAAHVDVSAAAGLAEPLRLAKTEAIALPPPGQRIALASDAAFSFLYPHILEGWREAGAEIARFSPLADEPPPDDCDVCWLPGGYPELHSGRLAAALRFRAGLVRFAETRPIHGECGGYMALGQGLIDAEGERHEMAGLLGLVTSFAKRKLSLGYRAAALLSDGVLGRAGARLLGHEHHYSTIAEAGDDPPLAMVEDAHKNAPAPMGSRRGRVSGSFFHVVAAG